MKWVTYLLGVIFAASGVAKLAALPFEVEAFSRWGYSPEFMYFTGVLEVLGAIAVVIPRLSMLAASGLAVLMLGAMATHATHAEWPMLILATGIFTLCAWRGWQGRAAQV